MGIFCLDGEDRLVDKFRGCKSIPVTVEELPSFVLVVSTALRDAAASAKECNLESSSGWGGASFEVGRDDLDEETPRITDCE